MRGAIRLAFSLAAPAVVVAACWFWPHTRDEAFVLLGSRDASGGWYGFWSGFGGSLPDLALITGGGAWYLNHTCHDHPACMRWGKYAAAGGLFKLCARHHPDLQGTRPRRDLIHSLHQEWKGRSS